MIIPSIDIMDGKAVQLVQGRRKVLEVENVEQLAHRFNRYGEVAVIDLDAALGTGDNSQLIQRLARIAEIRVGGGIRSVEKAEQALSWGAKKIILGTRAEPEFMSTFDKDRLIAAVDSQNGIVRVKGWTSDTGISTEQRILELQDYCSEFLYTEINSEGMLKGIPKGRIEEVRSLTANSITYAGGITTVEDVVWLVRRGMNAQIGMAVYTGKLDLNEAAVSIIDFSKGLVPTVVQDTQQRILTLAYSNAKSLEQALKTGRGTYYSRSRQSLWVKGETSGNIQNLLSVRFDCDHDALLFTVEQTGDACHTGSPSCFGAKEFRLRDLFKTIKDRGNEPRDDSYTSRILQSEETILRKIREEAEEVCTYTSRENLIWEIADLTYFVMTLMAHNGIEPEEVKNELWRRRR